MLPLGVGIWGRRAGQGRPVREEDVSGHEGMNGGGGEDMGDLYRRRGYEIRWERRIQRDKQIKHEA